MTGSRIGEALQRLLKSGAFWTALIAVASVAVAVWQVREAKEQFLSSNARGDYTDILSGLNSASPAVQVDAVARLVQFVVKNTGRGTSDDQANQAKTLQQTLVTFIRAESPVPQTGIVDYDHHPPQWDVAAVSVRQLEGLLANFDNSHQFDVAQHQYGISSVQLDHVDLHGFSQPNLTIKTTTSLVGADLREASLPGIRIIDTDVNLSQADLTCADLNGSPSREATLGSANLTFADLTGANLEYLDLRSVVGLTPGQVQHATYNNETLWPKHVQVNGDAESFIPPRQDDALESNYLECTYLIEHMTGMAAGQGYQPARPWPSDRDTSEHAANMRFVRAMRDANNCLKKFPTGLTESVFEANLNTATGQLITTCPRT
jgi:hypothetical protein